MNGNSEIGPPDRRLRTGSLSWLILLLLNAGVFLWAHGRAFRQPLYCNDDVRQQIYWMQQWRDASLYPNDLQTDYARHYVPWGVKGLYWLAARGMDPLVFAKGLTGFLFVALGALMFLLGRKLVGDAAGWCVAGTYWLMPIFLEHLAGGVAHSFAAPLLALFVLGWWERRPAWVGAAVCLQALFIPYLVPVCAGAALLLRAVPRRRRRETWIWPATVFQAGALVLALATALAWSGSLAMGGYGPWANRLDLAQPVFSDVGRYGIWPPSPLLYELIVAPWERIGPFQEMGLIAGAGITALLVAGLFWAVWRVDWRAMAPARPIALGLAAASLAAYGAAELFPLRLFIPSRYVIYPVHLAYAILVGLAAHAAWRVWAPRWPAMGAVALLAVAGLGAWRLEGVGLYDFSPDAPVVAAARTLPVAARLAGPPAVMDNVLAFGQRPVLVSFELAHPWLRGYWRQIEPRLRDFFAAYYAGDPAVIRAFCARYAVGWLIVDERDFPVEAGGRAGMPGPPQAPDFLRGRPFFAPFDQQIQALMADRNHFAILSPTDFPYSRIDVDRRLLDVRRPFPGGAGESTGAK